MLADKRPSVCRELARKADIPTTLTLWDRDGPTPIMVSISEMLGQCSHRQRGPAALGSLMQDSLAFEEPPESNCAT